MQNVESRFSLHKKYQTINCLGWAFGKVVEKTRKGETKFRILTSLGWVIGRCVQGDM